MKFVILLTFGALVSPGGPVTSALSKAANPVAARPAQMQFSGLVTVAQVDKWMHVWRKRLALEDWEIGIETVRCWDLKPETLGNLRWNSGTKSATIRVLDPIDYDLPATEIPADMEYTVLHELVHLQLAVLPRETASKGIEEQVVNRLSEALMALDKGPHYRARTAVTHLTSKEIASEASRAAKH